MNPQAVVANQLHTGNTAIVTFLVFVLVTLAVTYWAARRTHSTEDFYVAGRHMSALQNGLAVAGDFIGAAGFLGVSGLIALAGYDGLIFCGSAVAAFLLMMLLLVEAVRNLGKYTFADVLMYRLQSPTVRVLAALSALSLVMMFIIMQLVGAGSLVGLLFHIPYHVAVVIMGVIMLIYVLFGGMLATTWVQIIKCVLMMIVALVLAVLVLAASGFHLGAVFSAASARSGIGVLAPGKFMTSPLETISLGLSLLGVAGLPHVLMRAYTVPDARTARRSLFVAITVLTVFYLLIVIVGYGAMSLVGSGVIRGVERGGNMALPLLANHLGGEAFLGFVAAIAVATILANISGVLITGAATLSHDIWVSLVRHGKAGPGEQMLVAKIATVLLGLIGIVLGILFRGQNLAFLVGLANSVAVSANLPVLILALFWRRLTAAGAITGMIGGLGGSLLLIFLSPLIQVDILHKAAPIIALRNPGIIACPLAFLLAIGVSLATFKKEDGQRYAEIQRRMLIGA